jgi:putative nucleotidyltransferase-like protein
LLDLAGAHGVIPHLARVVGQTDSNSLPSALVEAVRAPWKRQLLKAMSLTAELFRVAALLEQAPIAFLVTKGPALAARAYGDVVARQYRDFDLLIGHAHIFQAAKLLTSAGYASDTSLRASQSGRVPGEYIFQKPETDLIFELHTERSFRYYPRPLPIEDFFLRKTIVLMDGRPVPALSLEDEFVLISIHGAKHFWERLMWISDVAALVHRHPELDWSRVRQSAADVGAERMVRVALLLAERVLRVPIPNEMKKEVAADSACLPIVKKIETWLPYAGQQPPQLMQRALFRFRMRGQLLDGARYLTRLSLSPTEEDWSADAESAKAPWREALSRPFRLAKKYRRDSKGSH